ncbi:MAG: hypothetical protein PHI28_16540, partial [Mangrovibacterium sp.]|nr:hypothetical protein [Mangrovibacterium sp.]
WFTPTQIMVWKEGEQGEQAVESGAVEGQGYHLEAAHVMECLDSGKTESDLLPLRFSLDLMELMDQVRNDAGIVFAKHDDTGGSPGQKEQRTFIGNDR